MKKKVNLYKFSIQTVRFQILGIYINLPPTSENLAIFLDICKIIDFNEIVCWETKCCS